MNKKTFLVAIGVVFASVLLGVGCQLDVNDPIRKIPIVEPYISVQPQSYSYVTRTSTGAVIYDAANPPVLHVNVSSWRKLDGKLSYQWYKFDDIEDYCENGGTLISGATDKTYKPPVIDAEAFGTEFDAMEETARYAAMKNYYYYAVVTNKFSSGTDKKSASIQSEVAMLSFTWRIHAPVLTKQPKDASYIMGRAAVVAPLEVLAISPGSNNNVGTISYQWYTNDKFSLEGGTKIEGATQEKYTPNVLALSKGKTYYYVEVTNAQEVTVAGVTTTREATIFTVPATIEMLAAEKAMAPRITTQPKDQMVLDGTIAALKVVAISPEANTEEANAANLSYQWYAADKPAETATTSPSSLTGVVYTINKTPVNGQPIQGATNATFTPTAAQLDKVSNTTGYFYVEVRNTNFDIDDDPEDTENYKGEGKSFVTLKSNVVTVANVTAASGTTPNTTITVLPTNVAANRYQYIRGYGGMDVAWANFPNTTEAETEMQYNPDWGLGYNLLRIMIVPPGTNDPNYTTQKWILDGLITGVRDDGTTAGGHRPDYVNNVKVVNKYNGFVLASPWTPPKEWKSNNSINSGGDLIHSYYRSFANYLRSFAQEMNYRGAPIYVISIANEPNYAGGYDGCEWSNAQMRDFWKEMGRFTEGVRGFGGGRSIPTVLTMNGESANNPDINFATLNDPVSRAAVDLYARHVYGSQLATLWENPYANYYDPASDAPYQTECWMTEHNINSASPNAFPGDSTWNFIWRFMNDIDLVIRRNNENGFVWWASKRFYSMIGDGQYTTIEGAVLPRGYGLSHYAKYSNGFTRVRFNISGTTVGGAGSSTGAAAIATGNASGANVNATPSSFALDTLDAKITAFVSQDGNEISFVMFTPTNTSGNGGHDLGTVKIVMPDGFLIGSAKAQKSTGGTAGATGLVPIGRAMDTETVTIDSDRKAAYVTLNRSQILSVKFTKQ